MHPCDELKAQAEQIYDGGINSSVEAAASCFRLCADGLSRFSGNDGGKDSIREISLLLFCADVSDSWNGTGAADRERISERLKRYIASVNGLCAGLPFSLSVPSYAGIGQNLMTSAQIKAFTTHLTALLQTLTEPERTAFIKMHYLTLYAGLEQWPQSDVLKEAYEGIRFPFDTAEAVSENGTATVSAAPTYAAAAPQQPSAAALMRYEEKARRRWRPLKVYLIGTGLFIALVLGLYFAAAPDFSYGQPVVVRDITGQSVSLVPDSEPVRLALVGLTDYDGVIRLFYGTLIGTVIYRIVTILAAFIGNKLYRRKNAQKAAALRGSQYIP